MSSSPFHLKKDKRVVHLIVWGWNTTIPNNSMKPDPPLARIPLKISEGFSLIDLVIFNLSQYKCTVG